LKTDLKNKFETGKPHLEKPNMIYHHLVVFIQHDPSELRGLKVVPPCAVRSQSVKIPAKHQTRVSHLNRWVRRSYYMDLEAM